MDFIIWFQSNYQDLLKKNASEYQKNYWGSSYINKSARRWPAEKKNFNFCIWYVYIYH